ncbi:hypothetical protein PN462_03440 [Spirulina sp. CS-785/01]|nr:hypothetical protein [Spirulina sp. CS-785/01]MDB9312143.1 hypothetical protein [Spirulina sp. CS-785/01]
MDVLGERGGGGYERGELRSLVLFIGYASDRWKPRICQTGGLIGNL